MKTIHGAVVPSWIYESNVKLYVKQLCVLCTWRILPAQLLELVKGRTDGLTSLIKEIQPIVCVASTKDLQIKM